MAFEDPDYDDFEFRELYPDIYGDDEPIASSRSSQKRVARKKPTEWTKEDEQFHQDYLKWKRAHPNRVKEIMDKPQKPEEGNDYPSSDEPPYFYTFSLPYLSIPPLSS